MVKPITNPTADAALNVRLLNNLSEMIGSTTFSSTKQNARSRMRLARPRPMIVDDAHAYWAAMEFALRWAELNRRTMMDRVEAAFRKHASVHRFERMVDVHHNYAVAETHAGVRGVVHRKGAVRAGSGDAVLVPGSMGTASYVGAGLGSARRGRTRRNRCASSRFARL